MWGSSYVSVYTAGDYQSPPDRCVLDIDRILAQQMQCGEDRQGMPAIIHAGSLPGSRIPPSSSDEWSDWRKASLMKKAEAIGQSLEKVKTCFKKVK